MGNKTQYEQIVSQDGIELWVQYNADQITEGNGGSEEYEIELLAVDIVIGKKGVNILDKLTKQQQKAIKELL